MDFQNKTTEKLKGELQGLKVLTGTLIGILLLLLIICIYGLVTKENNSTFMALIVVPIALSVIILKFWDHQKD